MAPCERLALFTGLSLLIMGCVVFLFLASVVMFVKYGLIDLALTLFIFVLVGLALSLAVFVFSLYASCHQKQPCRVALLVIFLVFDLGIIAIAIYCLALKFSIFSWIESLWDEPIDDADLRNVEAFENGFECCGWSSYRPECNDSDRLRLCSSTIAGVYRTYFTPTSAALVALGVVLMGGIIFAIRIVCTTEPDKDLDKALSDSLIGSSHATARTTHYNNYSW